MLFDLETLTAQEAYKVLSALIVPRPIAWITSLSPEGVRNAAPYSFFNMMGPNPPTVAIGLMPAEGRLKDSARNILETAEFVVNLVDEANAAAMNETCIDAPPDVDELALAGLETAESRSVLPPRIASAPVSLECRMLTSLVTGPLQTIVIGRVLCAHIADRYVLDAGRCYIDTVGLSLIGRMHGSGGYVRSTDRFQMERPTWAARQEATG
ncbi:flavin reductase family protein [Paracoccus sp. S-4012]|uniref:flavin reductase family protein n=1 Tax=Paracoccus sp. S-4012 TaxID=2665648 RepID=UPI0012AEF31E|nr:flavin reductase family protein [Paracoccus sp. S-4012]MRX50645.1 flavin reductase family protein [Paracoccus sp. S-4012]